jgi:hypothetical protein
VVRILLAGNGIVSYPGGRVGVVEDRLTALAEARLGAMSLEEVVAGFDAAHGLLVEA